MRFIALFIALCVSAGALAQGGWPAKPIRMVVPVTTGGPGDPVARGLGEKLSPSLRQPGIIENRPGGAVGGGAAFVPETGAGGDPPARAAGKPPGKPDFFRR